MREEEGVYGHNNGSISKGDRVSTVINHALWSWPHQGTKCSGSGDSEWYHTHQRLGFTGGAGLQALLPQNGCTALGLRSCQMLALLECLMNLLAAAQIRVLNRNERGKQGVEVDQKKRRGYRATVLGNGPFVDERSTN